MKRQSYGIKRERARGKERCNSNGNATDSVQRNLKKVENWNGTGHLFSVKKKKNLLLQYKIQIKGTTAVWRTGATDGDRGAPLPEPPGEQE